ncbi:putative ribonuclease H-like domain-containing protein, partial [Tanacetum coccineum]
MQARPDNEDCNMKFLRALPPSCYTTTSSSADASGNVLENVLHSFVAESDPQQQITYEDFDQIGKLDLEELDIKWQMAMLFVRINRFEKKAGRKSKFNNKDAARFDKKKVRCYQCSELGHFARECTGKKVDSKTRPRSEDIKKAEEDATGGATRNATGDVADDVSTAAAEFALMGISSQVQTCPFGCEHLYVELKKEFDNVEAQYKECYIQVQAYKSILQTLEQQKGWYQSNQLALEERIKILNANLENTTNMLKYIEKLNEQAKLEKMNDKVQLEESKARFDKWKDSSKNLDKLIHSSMSSRSKFGLGFGETFGSDEVFDPTGPSIFDTTPEDVVEKPLYDRFVKAVGMHVVPPPITGTFMPPSNNPDLDDTQFTYGSKSNNNFETNSVSNDFVSCDNSDKSSDSETTDFASCVSSVKSSSSKTNEPLASAPSSVDFKPVSKTADQQSNSTNAASSFSFKKNNQLRLNNCHLCGKNIETFSFVPDCHVPVGSRNRPTIIPAGSGHFCWLGIICARPPDHPPPLCPDQKHYFNSLVGWLITKMNMDGENGNAVKTQRLFGKSNSHICMGIQEQWWISTIYKVFLLLIHKAGLSIVDRVVPEDDSNKEKLADFVEQIKGVTVTFRGGDGKITGKGTIRTSNFNFENVYYVEELQNFNFLVFLEFQGDTILLSSNLTEQSIQKREINLAKHGLVMGFLPTLPQMKKIMLLEQGKLTQGPLTMAFIAVSTIFSLSVTSYDLFGPIPSKALITSTMPWWYTDDFNRVLVTRPHNKTPYELLSGKVPNISHLKPFGCTQDITTHAGSRNKHMTLFSAKDTLENCCSVPAGSGVPATSIPAGSINQAVGGSAVPSTPSSSVVKPSWRHFHHHPTTGIFSESTYDADFDGLSINLAPTIAVDPVPTRRDVWKLVPLPEGKTAIGIKWILKNKRDARGIVVRNKARLVAQGHRQEEGIDYDEVYVDDIIFGSTNKAWCTEFEVLMKGEFEMSAINQDKYVQDMLRRFDMESVRPATTPYEAAKPKSKDEPDDAVNVHLYRSMIGQPKLGLWYPRDSPFVLEAYSDSDYAGSNGDRKSTTGGCQFLGRRLISWQCKKQTVVATSSTEAEYVAAAHCCGQVGFLEKPKGSADYHQVLDFLRSSHIRPHASEPNQFTSTNVEDDEAGSYILLPVFMCWRR